MAIILKVGKVGEARTAIKSPEQEGYSWANADISSADSGRSRNAQMNKKIVGAKDNMQLQWRALTDSEASALLHQLKIDTYIDFEYPSPYEGGMVVKECYTGDISANIVSCKNGVCTWDISLAIIER